MAKLVYLTSLSLAIGLGTWRYFHPSPQALPEQRNALEQVQKPLDGQYALVTENGSRPVSIPLDSTQQEQVYFPPDRPSLSAVELVQAGMGILLRFYP